MKNRTILRAGIAALLGLAAAASVSGQSYEAFSSEWSRVTQQAMFHIGPFQAFPAFEIRRLGYGDNVYFEDRPVRDFTATLGPSLTVYLPLRRRMIFYVRDSPEYTFYLRETRMRDLTNGYGGGAKVLLFNRIVLTGDYERRSRIQTVSAELGRPTQYKATSASAGLHYETARRTSLGLSGSIQKISYEDISSAEGQIALSSVLDRTERSAALEIYYRVRSEAFLFFRAGSTEYRFDRAAGRDASAVQAVGGLRFPILGRISGTITVGYKKFDPKAADRPSYSGLIADSQVEARTGRFALRAGFGRDIGFSYIEDAFYYVSDNFSAGGSFYPAGFIRLDYGYGRGNLSYPRVGAADPGTETAAADPRKDKQWSHSGTLVFRIFRTFGLGIQATSERWTSTLAGWDRGRAYAGVYLTSRF